nr:MAG TPA: antitoxin [Caudoviricetes sp.]
MGFFKWIRWIRQHRCRHHYRKHWSRDSGPYGGYVMRCSLCGKEKGRYD